MGEGTASPLFLLPNMTKADQIKQRIHDLLEAHFTGTDWYLVEIKVLPNRTVQVFADRDGSSTIEDFAALSRMLEHQLNEELQFSDTFSLEVSSPGIDRPLTLLRQYRKNTGRQLRVELKDGSRKEGKLLQATEGGIELETRAAGKKEAAATSNIDFSTIKQTKVLISF